MKNIIPIALAILVGYVLLVSFKSRGGAPTETPAVFKGETSLDAAIAKGRESGKPVLAFMTADWCGPCQMMKKQTLSDAGVAGYIEEKMIAVYIDTDRNRADSARFSVQGIPTTLILRDGAEVARHVGFVGAEEYLAFLRGVGG